MWFHLLLISLPLVISWPAGYDDHALEEPLADDVPAYFKGKLLSHLHVDVFSGNTCPARRKLILKMIQI